MTARRFFLAHRKGDDGDRLAGLRSAAIAAIEAVAAGRPFSVTLGRDDHEVNFARCGSWAAWASDVGRGVDYLSREPRYHAIVVTSGRVGAATVQIVRYALSVRKPCFRLVTDDGALETHECPPRLVPVTQAITVDKTDWQSGYVVR